MLKILLLIRRCGESFAEGLTFRTEYCILYTEYSIPIRLRIVKGVFSGRGRVICSKRVPAHKLVPDGARVIGVYCKNVVQYRWSKIAEIVMVYACKLKCGLLEAVVKQWAEGEEFCRSLLLMFMPMIFAFQRREHLPVPML